MQSQNTVVISHLSFIFFQAKLPSVLTQSVWYYVPKLRTTLDSEEFYPYYY